MLYSLLCSNSLFEVLNQALFNQIFALIWYIIEGFMVKVELSLDDISYDFGLCPSREWYFTWKHDVQNYSHGPDIDFGIVLLEEDFGSNIVRRATHCVHGSALGIILRKTKIYHLDARKIILFVEHEVLRFDVSMWYLLTMQILQGWKQLFHDESGKILGQVLVFDDVLKELATLTVPIRIKITRINQNHRKYTYSRTKKQTSFHSQISYSLIMFGWSYNNEYLLNKVLVKYLRVPLIFIPHW